MTLKKNRRLSSLEIYPKQSLENSPVNSADFPKKNYYSHTDRCCEHLFRELQGPKSKGTRTNIEFFKPIARNRFKFAVRDVGHRATMTDDPACKFETCDAASFLRLRKR